MRICPACGRRLPLLSVLEPTRLLTLLCRRCWATVRSNRSKFVTSTVVGAMFGVGGVLGLATAGKVKFTDAGGLWSLVMLSSLAAGRLLPTLEVEDPPLE
jgi:hypothetical protein